MTSKYPYRAIDAQVLNEDGTAVESIKINIAPIVLSKVDYNQRLLRLTTNEAKEIVLKFPRYPTPGATGYHAGFDGVLSELGYSYEELQAMRDGCVNA